MYWLYVLTLFAILSCQSIKNRTASPGPTQGNTAPATPTVVQINPNTLTVNLSASEYKKNNLAGMLLTPKLDARASYISYNICTTSNFSCTEGTVDGLLPDVIYNAPTGPLQISYQACVLPEQAVGNQCGDLKTFNYDHVGQNSPPLSLALVENMNLTQQIISAGLATHQALVDYRSHLPAGAMSENANFESLVTNVLAIDPNVLGRMYVSSVMDDHFDAVRKELSKQRKETNDPESAHDLLGIGILSLGSPAIGMEFFTSWKQENQSLIDPETQDYVAAVEAMFAAKLPGAQNSQNALLADVNLVLQILASPSPQTQLLEKLASIERNIMRLKTLGAESVVKIHTLGNK